MNWDATLGVASVIAFTLPIVVIFYNRYYTHRSLAALLAYYAFILIDNLFGTIINSASVLGRVINYIDNYTNIPLILTALLFFCASKQRQGKVRMLTLIFIAYEIVIIAVSGFTLNSIIYIMGPGVGVVLLYSFYLFVRQIKFSIYHGKNHGRVLMLISIVFDFSCYGLIYFFQYIQKTPFQNDVFRLYYISSIISSVLMAIGLHMMRVRMKELQSLKTTRKELALIFGH
ncbi:MAG TPA: hypothetical protein VNT20_00060 [Flavisolibacter sp.]|jgi:hypothetical protein|nr:hypothetical protein [Flavisolibacter sp.]